MKGVKLALLASLLSVPTPDLAGNPTRESASPEVSRLDGRALDAEGQPLGGTTLELSVVTSLGTLLTKATEEGTIEWRKKYDSFRAKTDGAGNFAVEFEPPPFVWPLEFLLHVAERPDGPLHFVTARRIRSGTTDLGDCVLAPPGELVRGRLMDMSGEPVAGAVVSARTLVTVGGEVYEPNPALRTTSDDAGVFVLLDPLGQGAATFHLDVGHREFQRVHRPFKRTESQDLALTLSAGGTVVGRIANLPGLEEVRGGPYVRLVPAGVRPPPVDPYVGGSGGIESWIRRQGQERVAGDNPMASAPTDGLLDRVTGEFRLGGLEAGTYDFSVCSPRDSMVLFEVKGLSVLDGVVTADDRLASIDLVDRFGARKVRVDGVAADARVLVYARPAGGKPADFALVAESVADRRDVEIEFVSARPEVDLLVASAGRMATLVPRAGPDSSATLRPAPSLKVPLPKDLPRLPSRTELRLVLAPADYLLPGLETAATGKPGQELELAVSIPGMQRLRVEALSMQLRRGQAHRLVAGLERVLVSAPKAEGSTGFSLLWTAPQRAALEKVLAELSGE